MKKDLLREILLCVCRGFWCRADIVFVPCAGQAKEAGKGGGCSLRRFAAEVKADALSL